METMPKSYLTDQEREDMKVGGISPNGIYAVEASAACKADDMDAAWEWMSFTKIPAHMLKTLKTVMGADFILEKKLKTEHAEVAYGKDWLKV